MIVKAVASANGTTPQGFVHKRAEMGMEIFSDDARAHRGMARFRHSTVNHPAGELVR